MAVGLGAHPPAKTKLCIFVSSPSRAWINHMVSVSPPPASKTTFFGLASPAFTLKTCFVFRFLHCDRICFILSLKPGKSCPSKVGQKLRLLPPCPPEVKMADLRKAVRLQVHGLTDHDKRVGENHTNEQIDPNRSHLNYNLVLGDAWENYVTRLNEVYCLNRKDVNTLAMVSVTLPKEVRPEDQERFFEGVKIYFEDCFGKDNLISAMVHLDEKTPHIHIKAIPVYWNEKYQRNQVSYDQVCPRSFYKTLHSKLEQYMDKVLGYKSGILNDATREGNKSIEELKRGTAIEELSKLESSKAEKMKELESVSIELSELKSMKVVLPAIKDPAQSRSIPLLGEMVSLADHRKVVSDYNGLIKKHSELKSMVELWKRDAKDWESKYDTIKGEFRAFKERDIVRTLERTERALNELKTENTSLKQRLNDALNKIQNLDMFKVFYETFIDTLRETREDLREFVIAHLIPTWARDNVERDIEESQQNSNQIER